MSQLIHLIYSSAATRPFSRDDLTQLLVRSRRNNQRCEVTGMLLYANGSFFQILEGESKTVDELFGRIMKDERHKQVTQIIREPIAKRSFADWTMGFADITPQEADAIVGANDFFGKGQSFTQLGQGRAKKVLAAFKQGRWRAKLSGTTPATAETAIPVQPTSCPEYSFAYQPIIDARTREVFSYEALIRGRDGEPSAYLLRQVSTSDMHRFDEQSRTVAIELAARMGLSTHLNLNFLPLSLESSPTAITSIVSAARRYDIRPEQVVLEILERELVNDFDRFKASVNKHRGSGLSFAIDDFGAGYAGLNLLAEFQPDYIKLDMHLVRNIERSGPRQAIVRGILRTCLDLGIDIIAEGVETKEEYEWLRNEGIELFQGWLFAKPAFERLPRTFHLPH